MNIKGRGSRRKEKAPELLEFKDLQTSFYYFRGAGRVSLEPFYKISQDIKYHVISYLSLSFINLNIS